MTSRPVLLSGYAAKSCPRKVHNTYDQTMGKPPEVTTPPALQNLFDLGNRHEDTVFDLWLTAGSDVLDLRYRDGDKHAHIADTVAAMNARRTVILGGRLPDDTAGGRTGKPDALILDPDGGYHPCDVKAHKVLTTKSSGGATASLYAPALHQHVTHELGVDYKNDDLLQLAHYWRMLEASGHQATTPWGSIVGTDDPTSPVLAWYDVTAPVFTTFSRSRGKTQRSSLERYDHEHDFRVRVAQVARQRTGGPTDPEPLVVPVGQEECSSCPWAGPCADLLSPDDLSLWLPAGRVSVREYFALRAEGVENVADLADADLDDLLDGAFGRENTHVRGLRSRLKKAQLAADLTREGVEIRMRPGATFDIPRADVEIDLDIEWSRDRRVYLWGALVTTAGTSTFVPFLDLEVTDEASERALAKRCLDWLANEHPAALVYHYSPAEVSNAQRILGDDLDAYASTSAHPDQWIDLLPYVRAGFEGLHSLGLKTMATVGANFSWRDEDPGGLQSQEWLDTALAGDEAARQRVVAYNEDDVKATLRVRQWLASQNDEGGATTA